MQPYPRTWAEIDLLKLAHNLAAVRKRLLSPSTEIALVVKADAYGHGLVPVGRFALRNGAGWAAVATVQEGIALRDAGVDAPIMVLSPILPIESEQAVFYGLHVLFESLEAARHLSAAAEVLGKTAFLHLKVDTGLHRFGVTSDQAVELGLAASQLPSAELVGICQHFADSSRDAEYTARQAQAWLAVLEACAAAGLRFGYRHAANSAGVTNCPNVQGDIVRIGIIGYGIDPFNLLEGEARPVLSWTSRVTSLREVESGEPIGYSGTFRTSRRSKIATVGAGYGDGYPRTLSNRGVVGVRGSRADVVGLVCMDQLLLDVTGIPGVEVGDEVELIGPNVTVAELAQRAETNSHEIVTRIMSRVPRRYHY
ncbi:MAG: alanine racemase [Fimbriimonadaceae bacterium]|nr:alanine racemase [Fimbriimonadaceae bacterium]QYK55649.1 MAG: alanine racemase [Fimbriimonadaceae bacterium]